MKDLLPTGEWDGVARLLTGLLPDEQRLDLIADLAEHDVLVAAKSYASCGDASPEVKHFIIERALSRLDNADLLHKSNHGLLALLELGEVSLTIDSMLRCAIVGDLLMEVVREILLYNDGEYVESLFRVLDPQNRAGHKILQISLRSLDPTVLASPGVYSNVMQLAGQLQAAHRYAELKILVRRCGRSLIHHYPEFLTSFLAELVEGQDRKGNKHKRLDLAVEVVRRFGLREQFPESRIVNAILGDNQNQSLPNRGKLLGIAGSLAKVRNGYPRQLAEAHVDLLLRSPGCESLELAVNLIEEFSLYERISPPEAIQIFIERGMKGGSPEIVGRLIEKYRLTQEWPDAEWLGTIVEGEIVATKGEWLVVHVPKMSKPCQVWAEDAYSAKSTLSGQVRGKLVRIGPRGNLISLR